MRGGHDMRWGGLAGIGAVVLAVAGRILLGGMPGVGEPTGVIAVYLARHHGRILCGALLYAVAVVLLLWFGAALATAFRRADGAGDTAAVVLAGFVLVCAVGFVTVTAFAAMTYALTVNPALLLFAAALYTAMTVAGAVTGIAAALALTATAAAILRTGVLPRWVAWFAVAVAVVRLLAVFTVAVTSGPLAPGGPLAGYVPGVAAGLWLLATGGLLAREHLPAATVRAPQPTGPRRT